MTTLTYNTSRKQAADSLGVSTRTIDRHVKAGKLSYKKVANKVILAEEEIKDMQKEYNILHQQEEKAESVREKKATNRGLSIEKVKQQTTPQGSVQEFASILTKKDETIEEKNQLIYILQRKLGELETQMQQMIALPDHSAAKEELTKSIQALEKEKVHLQEEVKKEKLWNAVYIGLVLIAAVMILFFTFLG